MEGRLRADSIPIFNEAIGLVLSRWSVLRVAIENEWGGRDSRQKVERLGSDLLSWFTQSKEPLYIDDLENMLDDGLLTLNTEVEDGSIEEVAEKLMILHEECLEGNFKSIEALREVNLNQAAHPHAIQVVNNDEDDDDEDDNGDENNPNNNSNMVAEMQVPVRESPPKAAAAEAEDGWTVVHNRRNRGRN